jgi:hypothetical protein
MLVIGAKYSPGESVVTERPPADGVLQRAGELAEAERAAARADELQGRGEQRFCELEQRFRAGAVGKGLESAAASLRAFELEHAPPCDSFAGRCHKPAFRAVADRVNEPLFAKPA